MISSNSALVIQSRCAFESFRKKNFADKEAWVQTASYTQATKLIPLKKSGASLTVNSRIHVNFGFKCKVSKHDWFNDHIPHDARGNKKHSKGGREERITIWNINLKYYIQETQENFNSSPGPDKHKDKTLNISVCRLDAHHENYVDKSHCGSWTQLLSKAYIVRRMATRSLSWTNRKIPDSFVLLWPNLSRAAADHQKTWEESRKNPRRAQGPSDKRKWDREMLWATRSRYI